MNVAAIVSALLLRRDDPVMRYQKEECAGETGVYIAEPFRKSSFDDYEEKCFLACMMRESGIVVSGKAVAEQAEKQFVNNPRVRLDPEIITAMINECAKKANEEQDQCMVAVTLHTCIKGSKLY